MTTSKTATWAADEWADAVATVCCEIAEERGLLGPDWREAWWLRAPTAERVAQCAAMLDPAEVLRWDSAVRGYVWVSLAPDGAHTRLAAIHGNAIDLGHPIMAWQALKDATYTGEVAHWVRWWDGMARLRGAQPATAAKLGAWAVASIGGGDPDRDTLIGRVAAVRSGRMSAITEGMGTATVEIGPGMRAMVWSDKWRQPAMHCAQEGRIWFKSVDSALWTLVHKRKRMIKEGIYDGPTD
jgi:hypothetical protein